MYLDPQHWTPPTSTCTKSGRAGSANNLKGTNKDINIIKLLKNNIPCKGKGIIVLKFYFCGRTLTPRQICLPPPLPPCFQATATFLKKGLGARKYVASDERDTVDSFNKLLSKRNWV